LITARLSRLVDLPNLSKTFQVAESLRLIKIKIHIFEMDADDAKAEVKDGSYDRCCTSDDFVLLKLGAMKTLFTRRNIGCYGDRRRRAAYVEAFDVWCKHVLPLPSDEKCKRLDETRLEAQTGPSACAGKAPEEGAEETKFSIQYALDAALDWVWDPCKPGLFVFSDASVCVELRWPGRWRRVVVIDALEVPQGAPGKGMLKKLVRGLRGTGVAVSLNIDRFVTARR
jgi:hypothetical protein